MSATTRLAGLLVAGVLAAACAGAEPAAETAEVFARALHVASGRLDGEMLGLAEEETRPLAVGDAVRVDGSGEAHVRFSDFLLVRLFRDSAVQVDAMADPDAPPWAELRLEAGTVLADLDPDEVADRRLQITTEAAVVRAVGTRFLTHLVPLTAVTWVIVDEGVVEVTGAGTTVRVEAGFATFVVPGEAPQGPFPATREAIGDGLPGLDVLTNGALADGELLVAGTTGRTEQADTDAEATVTPDDDATTPPRDDGTTTPPDDPTTAPPEDPTASPEDPTTPPDDPDDATLTVVLGGDGNGVVTGPGIECGRDCSETYAAPAEVEVVATPAQDAVFAGWGVPCEQDLRRAVRLPSCRVELADDTEIRALFLRRFTVTVSVKGDGVVEADGQRCLSVCTVPVVSGDTVTLVAVDGREGAFERYTAPCGDERRCDLQVTEDVSLTAVFTAAGGFELPTFPDDLEFDPVIPDGLQPDEITTPVIR